MLKKKISGASPLIFIFTVVMFLGVTFSGDDDIYEKINRNMDLFGQVYKEVALNYVDEIDADKFMTAGIEGMLSTLDPYTNYIDEKSRDQMDLITMGKYGGIGISISIRDSSIFITEIMNGYEAQKKGLRVGDKIIDIDGVNLRNQKAENMRNLVRGPVGTEVNIRIERDGEEIPFVLMRQEIILKNVSYFGYLDPKSDGIGYIKLDRFTSISESEVENAIKSLKSGGELKGLILDLRDNGGGLLDAATGILNKLVPRNSLLLITKGKRADSEKKYFSKEEPMISPDVALAVLINNKTASASEIVSGAVQDLDRGVIVGTKSFGKGLVQQIKDLDKKAQIKITGSRYFTPSGRWIQEKNYFKENKYGVFVDKNRYDQTDFKTLDGRTVKAYGGIEPDAEVAIDAESEIYQGLLSKDMFFKFANYYIEKNPGVKTVIPDDRLFSSFKTFLAENNFSYDSQIEKKLKEIKDLASAKNFKSDFQNTIDKLESAAESEETSEIDKAKNEISLSIANEINKRIISESEQIEAAFPFDIQLQKGINILKDKSEYNKLLGKM
ncbi:MAG: PDZ domain-containing protein [Ignavibacteria bacterium]|nr:PDZ domain-containing protein [Ignavibacteria bacterium]